MNFLNKNFDRKRINNTGIEIGLKSNKNIKKKTLKRTVIL